MSAAVSPEPAAGHPGRREAQRLRTREQVYEAAVAEFKRVGVAEADVAAIVSAAKVARGTFYFHFPTKSHVIDEVKRRAERSIAADLEAVATVTQDLGSALQSVVGLVLQVESDQGRVLFSELLAHQFAAHQLGAEEWASHPLLAAVAALVERARDRGEVAAGLSAETGALFFLAGLYALLSMAPAGPLREALITDYVASQVRSLAP